MPIKLEKVKLHAEQIQQESRWYFVLQNYFVVRKKYNKHDSRRKACKDALIIKATNSFSQTLFYLVLSFSSLLALIISVQTLLSVQEQNIIESRSFLFDHAREIQKIFIENPEMYDYFYSKKEVPDTLNPVIKARILITAEMMTDMIDNAAGSRIRDLSEGWSEYTRYLYENGPAFRDFYLENKDWYPKVEEFLKSENHNRPPSYLDKIKKAISEL